MSKLLIHYPTRERPELFKSTLNEYYALLSGKHEVQVVITLDNDDATMQTPGMRSFMDGFANLTYHYGNSQTKIQACNADIPSTDWDILILASDDMVPIVQSYDDIIATDMQKYFPDSYGALWYFDGGNAGVCTQSIMNRKLYDYFGYIYHPDYRSVWCDTEFTQLCTEMNCMKQFDRIICEHQWIGKCHPDELHRLNNQHFMRDFDIFETRKERGFPKASVVE